MADKKPEPAGYTVSLFVTRTTPAHTETTGSGYQAETIQHPRETTELARIELRHDDLEAILSGTSEHIDLIRTRHA